MAKKIKTLKKTDIWSVFFNKLNISFTSFTASFKNYIVLNALSIQEQYKI